MTTPEGEGAQSGAQGTQSGAGQAGPGSNGTPESGTGDGTQSGTETQPTEADRLRSEAESYREKMKAADKRASDFEAKFKQLTEKDMPEVEKLKRDFEEATQQVVTLRETNSKLALENAFLADNTYEWHNPKRAMQVLDRSKLEIQDDGSVSGLKEALKALATSDPYLLKPKVEEEKPLPGGTSPGNNGGIGGSKPDAKKLATRFPAMNTRVRRG
jgi:hypothetical protein